MKPFKADIAARAARERAELACAKNDGELALAACRMHLALYDQRYIMFPLVADVVGPARYAGRCVVCNGAIARGDIVFNGADVFGCNVVHERCWSRP